MLWQQTQVVEMVVLVVVVKMVIKLAVVAVLEVILEQEVGEVMALTEEQLLDLEEVVVDQMEIMEIVVQLEEVLVELVFLVKEQMVLLQHLVLVDGEQVVLEVKTDTLVLDQQLVEVEQWVEEEVEQKMILGNMEFMEVKVM